MHVMIVVPHPDDEVLGFGGIIQKHRANGDIVFVNFMSAVHSKRMETQYQQFPSVGKLLGYTGQFTKIVPDDEHFRENVKTLEKSIAWFKPDVLATTFYGDNHQDHDYIFKVVKTATRIWAPFLVKKIIMGEILSSTDQAPKLSQYAFVPTYYVPLTGQQINTKIEAMELYDGEMQEWPHPRCARGITNLAERRGMECKHLYAESFMVLRDIENF